MIGPKAFAGIFAEERHLATEPNRADNDKFQLRKFQENSPEHEIGENNKDDSGDIELQSKILKLLYEDEKIGTKPVHSSESLQEIPENSSDLQSWPLSYRSGKSSNSGGTSHTPKQKTFASDRFQLYPEEDFEVNLSLRHD